MKNNRYLYSGTKNYRTFFYSLMLVIALLFAASFINLGNLGGLYAADWTSKSVLPETFSDGYVKITSAQEFAYVAKNISTYKSKNIRLASNIDMGGYTWTPIGNSSYKYSGTFDGAGYVIRNMTVNTTQYAGLFGYASSATIKNVIIVNASVNANNYAGGIVGCLSGGKVENCDVQTSNIISIYSSSSSNYAGGIAGCSTGTITKCRGFSNTVSAQQSYASRSTTVYNYAGGIVGYQYGGALDTCANANGGKVTTYTSGYPKYAYTGGIAGYTSTKISNSYNQANVTGGDESVTLESYTGGVAGYSTKEISDCFNTGDVSGYAMSQTWSSSTFNPYSGTVQFASGVGALWAFDLYIVSGQYTDNGGSGPFKNDSRSSSKSQSGRKAFVGGISGYATNVIKRVYNLGKIGGSDSTYTQYYSLNFKWKANRQYNMRFASSISYGYQYNAGNIVGYTSSSVSNAYFESDTKISKSFAFSASQNYYGKKTTKSGMTLSSWTKNKGSGKTDTAWYLKSMDGCDYFTYHNIDASSCSKIKFSARYHNTDEKQKETTYYTIDTGLSSTTYSEKGTSGTIKLSNLNGNSKFATNSKINGGYPYLKDMYW